MCPFIGLKSVRQLKTIAVGAHQTLPQLCAPSRLGLSPGPVFKRRTVADMLAVTTVELGHPVLSFVAVKTKNAAFHTYDTMKVSRPTSRALSVPSAVPRSGRRGRSPDRDKSQARNPVGKRRRTRMAKPVPQ